MYSRLSVMLAAGLLSATVASAQTTTPMPTPSQMPAPSQTPSAPPAVTPPPATAPSAAAKTVQGANVTLTDEEARKWIDKVVYSRDDKNLGEVAAFVRDSSGKVTELHADIGGFLGLGETRVRLLPNQFMLAGDRVVLTIPAEEAKMLPKLAK